LCKRLVANGKEVVAFVRPTSNVADLRALGVECRTVDIKDCNDVMNHFECFDLVYHVAAAYRSEHAERDEFRLVNVEATRNMLDAAKKYGIKRFIHCSTVGVQGEIEDAPASEEYRFKPGDHYQQSKLEGELLAREYFDDGLEGVVIRPVGIYGPGDTRFLKLFRPINKGHFFLVGNGNTLYHMTYIDDLIEGFILAGERTEAIGEVFTIAGERYTPIRELIDTIADVLGKPRPKIQIPFLPVYLASVICDKMCRALGLSPPLYPRRVEFFQLDRAFSIDKARRLLGYQPKISLEKGLQLTADWYKAQGLI
jgi:nucleoside-diphosphate-sugar epimerase